MASLKENYLEGIIHEDRIHEMHIMLGEGAQLIEQGTGVRDGMCALIRALAYAYNFSPEYARRILICLFQSWDGYSGDPLYPVPGANGFPHIIYENYRKGGLDLWDRTSLYGTRRRDLYLHCINEVAALRIEIQNGLREQLPNYTL